MARGLNKLTARQAATLAPGMHSDGGGLYLRVRPNGARSWIFISTVGGQRRERGLGTLRSVSLAEAREKAAALRQAVSEGTALTSGDSRKMPAVPVAAPSFGRFADQLINDIGAGFRNAKHRAQWRSTLATHAAPLRPKSVDEISTDDVVAVLKPLWLTVPETASRLRGRIERVLDAAKAKGYRTGDNPARWRGHLSLLLPKRQTLSRGHYAALPFDQIATFVAALQGRPAMAARALEFTILTAARTGEVRGARWGEIDLDQAIWTVPAERMKAGRVHRVPLSSRAVEILQAIRPREVAPDAHVFKGERSAMLSNMAMAMLLRRMGHDSITVHGFRSTFRDWAGEVTAFPRDVVEMALAHCIESKVERAYRRGDAFEKRRELMTAWADFCLQIDKP